MKTTMKRMLALVLALCMLALAACTTNPQPQQTKPQETKPSESGKSTDPQEVIESKYPDYLNLDGYRPIVKEGEEITLRVAVVKNKGVTGSLNDVWFTHFIEQELNINLDLYEIDYENRAEKINLLMNSGDLPDIMMCFGFTPSDIIRYGVEGEQLLPISDYLSEELTPYIIANMEEKPTAKEAHTAPDGKMYALPSISGGSVSLPDSYRVFINTVNMNAAGYETQPDDLDAFVQMLRDFKAHAEASGVEGYYPLLGDFYDRVMWKNAFGWMANTPDDDVSPLWDVETNQIVVPAATEKYEEYIKLFRTLYEEELIHPDYFTMDRATIKALQVEKKCGVYRADAPYTVFPDKEGGWEDFIAVTPLRSEYNPDGLARGSFDFSANANYHINADTEYPELCVRFLDYLCSPEGMVYHYYGAPAGSADTLGLIDGWQIVDGQLDFGTADDEYSSLLNFRVNTINLSYQFTANDAYVLPELFAMVGETYGDSVYDIENNPDHHYRVLLNEACRDRLTTPVPNAYISSEDNARYSDLKTVLNDYVNAEFAKFVVGLRPLDEIPAFQKELEAMGMPEFIQLCQKIYSNYNGPTIKVTPEPNLAS